jgi:endonuclease-3
MPRATVAPKGTVTTRRILTKLAAQHPGADTELHYSSAYELLVATILSAQCTDERVNRVTPALFKHYPDARRLAAALTGELETEIQSTGFFRAKSRSLVGMAAALVERHTGEVPRTMEALVALPGVGRKTANVVLGHALGVPGLPVDRHVLRVANRIGIARSEDPEVVEQQLCAAMPPEEWTRTSDTLILHGRRICRPRPLCDQCAVRDDCDYYRTVVAQVQPTAGGARVRARDARPAAKPPRKRRVAKVETATVPEKSRTAKPRGTGSENGRLPGQRRAVKGRGTRRGA